ncbi:ATP-grasp domain-containing protein [Aureibaculum conchae]|uniref:ATP-grasp domain-containing protein n=1 Tax=Aureibaculum sp. 2308TA14-22 TaxID=3108392 RepID=UPI00339A071F
MAKKVGILFGMEDTFPWAFIDRVNELGKGKVVAEAVQIDKVQQGIDYGYDVIIDRISQEVPFYRAYLKNAALMGTAVINNPFWWSADEKFFNNCLSMQIGVPVPKTILLPSNARPDDTTDKSFRNLKAPLDWDYIFDYIGFPAYMKPHAGGGWKSVYRVDNPEDLFEKHGETEQLVMMLQEEIVFDDYYRVYCLGQKYVHIMPYEPRNEPHLRYVTEPKTTGEEHEKLMKTIHNYTIKLNKALGYDFNTVEFAIRNGVPYAIDFCNPAPDADINSVGQTNFDWIVEHSAKLAVEKALAHKAKQNNTSWGTFLKNAIAPTAPKKAKKSNLKTVTQAKKDSKAALVKKTAAKKATVKKAAKATPVKKVVAKKPAPKAKVVTAKKAVVKTKTTAKPKTTVKKVAAKPKTTVKKTTAKPKTTSKKK